MIWIELHRHGDAEDECTLVRLDKIDVVTPIGMEGTVRKVGSRVFIAGGTQPLLVTESPRYILDKIGEMSAVYAESMARRGQKGGGE